MRPIGEDERAEQDRDADHDEGVGEVERRPGDEIEEVGDVPEANSIDEVRDASAEHETERDGQHGMPTTGAREEDEHRADGNRRDGDDDGRPAPEEPERDAGVLDVIDRERADDVDAVPELERSPDDLLRELVGGDRRTGDDEENDPLRSSGAERAFGRRDRLQGVRGRADADVDRGDLGPRRLAQLCSSARLSSMQSLAYGTASSRSSSIGRPQLAQRP